MVVGLCQFTARRMLKRQQHLQACVILDLHNLLGHLRAHHGAFVQLAQIISRRGHPR